MDDIKPLISPKSSKLFDQLRLHMRDQGLAYQTERTYILWIKRFIYFHNKRDPKTMGAIQVGDFLSHLANVRGCSVNTQRTVLKSLAYLYKRYFQVNLVLINARSAKTG